MIKRIVLVLVSTLIFSLSYAQNFDLAIENMAKNMAKKLNEKNDLDIAVYPFYNKAKKQTDLSKLISDDFSVYLNQSASHFKIIERSFLEQMMEEHQLNDEGLIDPRTAKEFGMILAADAYITGKTMVLGAHVRLHVFAIDTQTGERIYSDFKKIPLDYDIAEFVGIDLKKRKDKENQYRSEDKECAKLQVGDFCFMNKTKNNLTIKINSITTLRNQSNSRSISVQPNERKCFKNLSANKSYRYTALKSQIFIGEIIPKGEFFVETCKSDVISIR